MGETKDPDHTAPRTSSHEEQEEKVEEQGDAGKSLLRQVMDVSATDRISSIRVALEDHINQINPMPVYTRPLQRQTWSDVQVS
jgi:DNA-binding TFAR19-related protein (PDSD5 family)